MRAITTMVLLFSIGVLHGQDAFEQLTTEECTIEYPTTWELNQSGQMGMSFILLSPLKLQGDQFRENVNLVIQDLSGYDMDLTDFINLSENQIKSMITEATFLTSERKGDFHEISYTGTMDIYKLQFFQRCWLIDRKAYILTFTAEQEQYDNYHAIAQQIFASFKVK